MDVEDFRKHGHELIDFIIDCLFSQEKELPNPKVETGYMSKLIPDKAPEDPDEWKDLLKDIQPVILDGITNLHSPNYHGFYPLRSSFPSILGELLRHCFETPTANWMANPAGIELEMNMTNWLGKMLQLPEEFLFDKKRSGGGVILTSASESVCTCLLAARTHTIREVKKTNPNLKDGEIITKLVSYTSAEAHPSVIKAGLISCIEMRIIETDSNGGVNTSALEKAILSDIENGLIPIFVCANLGSTGCCGFDNLNEIGAVCNQHKIWMHIDAAYAGSAFICPEYRYLLDGVELATSFNFNAHKWLEIAPPCSVLWVKNSKLLSEAFPVDLCAENNFDNKDKAPESPAEHIPVYRHWSLQFTRDFKSIKVWFQLRLMGIKALQEIVRTDISMAKLFESLVKEDNRFEIVVPVTLAVVCFRLKGTKKKTKDLLELIRADRRIFMIPSALNGIFFIRFVISSSKTTPKDVHFAWKVIQEKADQLPQQLIEG
ncbi:hypothetical protein LOTGIDRAFT_181541 [Lottia gigantea]|uniref:Aromatic-L-amino-acid decarboxylase n=1 Tax=Lottia gigantea TaxID=225164 RepID=V4ARR7_LOTGI|nr:hypothetical protein LOTGIDRAFT_181541 [Lottia gigantea]ESO97540.1 hypothetical protein LOTGIDRAFT_181541 [Lottia gigantea]